MNKLPLEIVIPVYNEGENLINVLQLLDKHVKTNFKVLICYDNDDDDCFTFKETIKKFKFDIEFVKNFSKGPGPAIKRGLNYGNSDCVVVYPADDSLNCDIVDSMFKEFKNGNDVVVASRFIEGGYMRKCPLVKSIIVRFASFSLYYLSSIPVRDASHGLRLFSRKLLNTVNVESTVGFSYAVELLVKCHRLKKKITEVPALWEERSEGKSRFKLFKWIPQYLKWYLYGLGTTWLKKNKI